MENQNQVTNSRLQEFIISEIDLLAVLNIEQSTLNELRLEKAFPVIRLNGRNRVYLIKDVVGWLESHKSSI
jgi:nucleoside-triphosphatase THEP1